MTGHENEEHGTMLTCIQSHTEPLKNDISNKKRDAKPRIKVLKKRIGFYIIMLYVVAFYSGFLMVFQYLNTYFMQHTLKVDSGKAALFNSVVSISWIFKPVYGYISECFFPFKYRLKSYIVASCILISAMSISLLVYTPQYEMYMLQFFFIFMGYGIIDTLGEGLTALIMKTEKEIQHLSSFFDPNIEQDIDNKKSFGNFYNFRSLVRNVFIFVGGALSTSVSLKWFFIIQLLLSIAVVVYTIFFFFEPKVDQLYHN